MYQTAGATGCKSDAIDVMLKSRQARTTVRSDDEHSIHTIGNLISQRHLPLRKCMVVFPAPPAAHPVVLSSICISSVAMAVAFSLLRPNRLAESVN